MQGFYAIHKYATPTAGRPAGGVTCFLKGTMGKIEVLSKKEDTVIIRTTEATLIALYIPPGVPIEDIVGTITEATEQTKNEENVILAGDFNCRTDKPNTKTDILLDILEEEGFKLANRREDPTYIAPNGTSMIDLIFYRGKSNSKKGYGRQRQPP